MAICFADFQCFFTTHAANKKLLDCHECPDLINIKADISEYAFLQSIFTKYKRGQYFILQLKVMLTARLVLQVKL